MSKVVESRGAILVDEDSSGDEKCEIISNRRDGPRGECREGLR
jgi:hypothetical protein